MIYPNEKTIEKLRCWACLRDFDMPEDEHGNTPLYDDTVVCPLCGHTARQCAFLLVLETTWND